MPGTAPSALNIWLRQPLLTVTSNGKYPRPSDPQNQTRVKREHNRARQQGLANGDPRELGFVPRASAHLRKTTAPRHAMASRGPLLHQGLVNPRDRTPLRLDARTLRPDHLGLAHTRGQHGVYTRRYAGGLARHGGTAARGGERRPPGFYRGIFAGQVRGLNPARSGLWLIGHAIDLHFDVGKELADHGGPCRLGIAEKFRIDLVHLRKVGPFR